MMAGLREALMPRTAAARASGAPWYSPKVGLASILDQASLPGRAYVSLGRPEGETYLDALGRTEPRYDIAGYQGEGDEFAETLLRDPSLPIGAVGGMVRGLGRVGRAVADAGIGAATGGADQYAQGRRVSLGDLIGSAALGAVPSVAMGGKAPVSRMAGEITPEQRAANFKNWFGDSKVVDEAGNPLVVYHGTAGDFDTFSFDELGRTTGATSAKKGFFFSENPYDASSYIIPALIQKDGHLNIGEINPLIKSQTRDEFMSRYGKINDIEKEASMMAFDILPKINRISIQRENPFDFAQKIDESLPIGLGVRSEPHKFGGENIFLGNIPVGRTGPRNSGGGFIFDSFLSNYDKLRNGLSGFLIQESRPDLASLKSVYLKAENPKILDSNTRKIRIGESASRKRGTDATNFRNVVDPIPSNHWIVYDPTQIKSATGNRGTFDPNDPNITHFARSAPNARQSTPIQALGNRIKQGAAEASLRDYLSDGRKEQVGGPVRTSLGGFLLASPGDTPYTRRTR